MATLAAIWKVPADPAYGRLTYLFGFVFFLLLVVADFSFMAYRIRRLLSKQMRYQEKADGCLIMSAVFSPLVGLCSAMLIPNFLADKNWIIYAATNIISYSAILDLPPSHQFITWITQCTTFSILGFLQARDAMTCTSTTELMLSIAKHLATHSLPLFVIGFVNSLIPVLILLKQRSDVAHYIDRKADTSRVLFHPPLSSIGIIDLKGITMGPQILEFLSWIDAKTYAMSVKVDETNLALNFYGTMMVGLTSYFIMARSYTLLPAMPTEGVIFSLLVFFLMGRQMSRLDVIPALQFIEQKLEQSQDVMQDLLPGFVVEALMSNNHDIVFELGLPSTQLVVDPMARDIKTVEEEPDDLTFLLDSTDHVTNVKPPSNQKDAGAAWQPQPLPAPQDLLASSSSCTPKVSLQQITTSGPRQSQRHECVTVFFSDLVGFSTWSHTCNPDLVMETLDNLFSRLDTIIMDEMPGLYKVETVGDAYIVAANLVDRDEIHALTAVRFALRAQHEASQVFEPGTTRPLKLRIGVHSGSVSAGIIGKMRMRYCLFGDTVNMAARTESSCPHGAVQVTESTYRLLQDQSKNEDVTDIHFVDRGLVNVKGSSQPLHMYLASSSSFDRPSSGRSSLGMNRKPSFEI